MPALITTLIDRRDNFEVIRDQIAAIILTESVGQQALAEAADPAKDPRLWKLRVYVERSNPWGDFQDASPIQIDVPPIVNVTFESSSGDKSASTQSARQKVTGTFNIDCYGYGVAGDDGDGHKAGDEAAGIEAARAARLVRCILMAEHYQYLGLPRGSNQFVGSRWVSSLTMFQPAVGNETLQQIVGCRLALQVDFNEFSPQFEAETLEILAATVLRAETGEIYFKAQYGE